MCLCVGTGVYLPMPPFKIKLIINLDGEKIQNKRKYLLKIIFLSMYLFLFITHLSDSYCVLGIMLFIWLQWRDR